MDSGLLITILADAVTLTKERSDYLLKQYENKTLDAVEKSELQDHLVRAILRMEHERDTAKDLLLHMS